MQIQAAILEDKDKLSIRSIYSRKLLPGQVLVKILYSGICRSQLMEIAGLRGEDKWLPHLLGHEGSGVVLEVGKDVKKVKKNDEVILTWIKGEGKSDGATFQNAAIAFRWSFPLRWRANSNRRPSPLMSSLRTITC